MNVRSVIFAILPLIAACTSTPAPHTTTSTLNAIQAANRELMDRYNRGDKLGVARMYEDTAILMSSGGERYEGRAAIDAYWNPPADPARPTAARTWTLEVLSLEGTDTMPIQRGRSLLKGEWQNKPSVSDVQFLVVWRKQSDGTHKIAIDAWWPTGTK